MDSTSTVKAFENISIAAKKLSSTLSRYVDIANIAPGEIQALLNEFATLHSTFLQIQTQTDINDQRVSQILGGGSADFKQKLEDFEGQLRQLQQIVDEAIITEASYRTEEHSDHETIELDTQSTPNSILSEPPTMFSTIELLRPVDDANPWLGDLQKHGRGNEIHRFQSFDASLTGAERNALATVRSKTWRIVKAQATGKLHRVDLMQHHQGDKFRIISNRLLWVGVSHPKETEPTDEKWKRGFHFVDSTADLSRVGNTVYAKSLRKQNFYRQTCLLVCDCDLEITFDLTRDAIEVYDCLKTLQELHLRAWKHHAVAMACLSGDSDIANLSKRSLEALTAAELHDVHMRGTFERAMACVVCCLVIALIIVMVYAIVHFTRKR